MIRLSISTFANALRKALDVRPAVRSLGGSCYVVARSDGGEAQVSFTLRDGDWWVSCSCPAGAPCVGSRRSPAPCYHAGAAAAVGGFLSVLCPVDALRWLAGLPSAAGVGFAVGAAASTPAPRLRPALALISDRERAGLLAHVRLMGRRHLGAERRAA